MTDRDPVGVARAAELIAGDEDWDRLEDAALELLGIARRNRGEQRRET